MSKVLTFVDEPAVSLCRIRRERRPLEEYDACLEVAKRQRSEGDVAASKRLNRT
ncbi:hypothetical protein ACKWRH_17010 [Bradyrhizobium sp. Pa8]|uniref:hypothetical protein n=1 Tax=Bradyrhizobium sp. Pa8 TaxID=3386552 RepID=UPI00403F5629